VEIFASEGHHRFNDTGGKCAASVNYTGGMTPAANLPPVSTTPAANFATGTTGFVDDLVSTMFQKIIKTFLIEDVFHLPLVSTTPVVHPLRISPRILEKIRNVPNGILKGLGEIDS
jgi:hypothetical protein